MRAGHSYTYTTVPMAPYQAAALSGLPADYLQLVVSSAPDMDPDLVRVTSEQISLRFTPRQARELAAALIEHADRAEVANG